MNLTFVFLLSYLIGSIPFCYILAYLCNGVDLRKTGSGNVGATNLYRVCGFRFFVYGFILDFLKGYALLFIISHFFKLSDGYLYIIAFSVLIGHAFPIFLNFQGGKGVSTGAGVVFFFYPFVFLAVFFMFAVLFLLFKRVSLASIVSSLFLVFFAVYFHFQRYLTLKDMWFLIFIGCLIVLFHKKNIIRLLKGEEERIDER